MTPVKVSDDHERIYEEWGKSQSCTRGEVREGSDKYRWLEAMTPVKGDDERIYEERDKSQTCTRERWGRGVTDLGGWRP